MTSVTRLVIADDHTVVRQGLQSLLALEPDLRVVAACADGEEAIEATSEHRPDVLLMDLSMPRCGGLEVRERLAAAGIPVRILVLSATMDDPTLMRCLELGVEGIVLKESAASIIAEAIRAVARGERWIQPTLSARALALTAGGSAGPDGLTAREKEIVVHVARGSSNKRVAALLGISESTVKLHLHSAFAKLRVRNRVQLSLLARERGWL
jgi:two-component system nitrate/nitrite response regulator NarL